MMNYLMIIYLNDYLSAFGIKTKISLSDIIMENYCKKKK